jgi:predicted Rossmann fold flavoprotein
MFPQTNTSAPIINCLLSEAKQNGADLSLKATVTDIEKTENGFIIHQKQAPAITTKKLILATGSSPAGHAFAKTLGHTIEKPLPSLFTFNIPNSPLAHLSGIATQETKLTLKEANLSMLGPLLITHFGFSGPAALKLSAFGAIYLHEKNYHAPLTIDWLPSSTPHQTTQKLLNAKTNTPTATLQSIHLLPLPKNLQKALFPTTFTTKISTLSNKALTHLAEKIHQDTYQIDGKTTNKEEFVTCGGVKLSEINFKTMESKVCPNLHLAGEILNIDGITGGFNFQAAWTTAYLASP